MFFRVLPKVYTGLRRTIIPAVAIFQFGLFSGAANAETDLAECYGERLEISMIARTPQGQDDGKIVFSLPKPGAWQVTLKGGGEYYSMSEAPCLEEPVFVSWVRGGLYDDRVGWKVFPQPTGDPRKVRRTRDFWLSGGLDVERMERREQDRVSAILENGVKVEGGFIRRIPDSPQTKTNGGFLFPDDYRSPLGLLIPISCPWKECNIDYRFTEQIQISYRFWNTEEYNPDWIILDQAVREILNDWIVE